MSESSSVDECLKPIWDIHPEEVTFVNEALAFSALDSTFDPLGDMLRGLDQLWDDKSMESSALDIPYIPKELRIMILSFATFTESTLEAAKGDDTDYGGRNLFRFVDERPQRFRPYILILNLPNESYLPSNSYILTQLSITPNARQSEDVELMLCIEKFDTRQSDELGFLSNFKNNFKNNYNHNYNKLTPRASNLNQKRLLPPSKGCTLFETIIKVPESEEANGTIDIFPNVKLKCEDGIVYMFWMHSIRGNFWYVSGIRDANKKEMDFYQKPKITLPQLSFYGDKDKYSFGEMYNGRPMLHVKYFQVCFAPSL